MTSFISNAFQIPNDLIDNGHMAKMKGAALPCYLLIVRKTRGWNKQADSISLSQFKSNWIQQGYCTKRPINFGRDGCNYPP